MKDLKPTCRIAVVQAAPVLFDKTACTDKAVRLIAECAQHGAELIVFPELFIPGYPYGMTFGFTVGSRTAPGRKDWGLYYDNSILVSSTIEILLLAKILNNVDLPTFGRPTIATIGFPITFSSSLSNGRFRHGS